MGLPVKVYGSWTTTIATCKLTSMSELEVSKLVNGRENLVQGEQEVRTRTYLTDDAAKSSDIYQVDT